MGRGGVPKDREDGPDRKCIATGDVQPKHGLVRFVVGPDDHVVPDILGKLPGRGIYVAADRAAPNCDTWGARLWWTHATCCRGSRKTKRRARNRDWQGPVERIDNRNER